MTIFLVFFFVTAYVSENVLTKMENCRNVFTFLEKSADLPQDSESFSSISSLEEDQACLSPSHHAKVFSEPDVKKKSHRPVHKDHSSQEVLQHSVSDHSVTSIPSTHRTSHASSHKGSGKHNSSSGRHRKASSDQHSHSSPAEHKISASRVHKASCASSPRHHSPKRRAISIDSGKHADGSQTSQSLKERRRSDSSSKEHSHKGHNRSYKHIYDLALIVNNDIGYVTSPDISSEEEVEENESVLASGGAVSPRKKEEDIAAVELSRHALKPTVDRYGGSISERSKVLAKLQAIQDRMTSNEPPVRKRAARGEKKRMRAKREHLEGDFSGSCLEKIEYDLEEKPSLRRPEPKPEPEPKKKEKPPKVEKPRKAEKPKKTEKPKKVEKHKKAEKRAHQDMHHKHQSKKKDGKKDKDFRKKQKEKGELSGFHKKFKHFHRGQDKVNSKPRPRQLPAPVSFTDLMKMAEQKHAKPLHLSHRPHKKEEHRRVTQINRRLEHGMPLKDMKSEADEYDSSEASPGSSRQVNSASHIFSKRHQAEAWHSDNNSDSEHEPSSQPMNRAAKDAVVHESGLHGSSRKPSRPRSSSSCVDFNSIRNVWDSLFSKKDGPGNGMD